MVNSRTGLGTAIDKTESSFWLPTLFYYKQPLEILAVQSWAARKLIRTRVADALLRWREFESDDETSVERMEAAEKKHKVKAKLAKALRASRQFGTAVIVMMTKEAPLDTPLMPERIREGDLLNLVVLDRYDLSVPSRDRMMESDNYGNPEIYECFPSYGGYAKVHHSRILRFDGIKPDTDSGYTVYTEDWGVSSLVPAILPIVQDQGIASEIANLVWEASIPVLGVSRLREAVTGEVRDDDATPEQIGEEINRAKSNHRLLLVDRGREEFYRIAVQFGGLAEMMDKYPGRIASSEDMPQTRWMGRSPAGMNATGDSDMRNWILSVEGWRDDTVPSELEILDQVLARDAGLPEPLEYNWPSLLEMSDAERVEVAKATAETLEIAQTAGWIDEDEGRKILDGDPIFGELPGPAPEEPDPEPGMDPDDPFGPPMDPNPDEPPPDPDPDEGAT